MCLRAQGVQQAPFDTDRAFPPTKGARALRVAEGRIGAKEEGGKNQGEIVAWSMEWLFRARGMMPTYAEWYRAGKLRWCSGFVGRCFLEVGVHVTPYWAASCNDLLVRLLRRSRREGDWLVRRWPCDLAIGDVVFFGDGPHELSEFPERLDLDHVEIGQKMESSILYSVGGNTGPGGVSNQVARMERGDPPIYATARAL
jgi:hypothetical protein